MSQEDMAELFGVTRQTISNWENGKSYPDITFLIKLSNEFDISLDQLLKGDEKVVESIAKNEQNKKLLKAMCFSLSLVLISVVFSFTVFKPKSSNHYYEVETIYNTIRVQGKNECNKKTELYFTNNGKNIYLYCLNKIEIVRDNEVFELEDYLKTNDKTIDDFVNIFVESERYRDGGSILYHELKSSGWYGYNYKLDFSDISILKCNTVEGNNDVYIGIKDMGYEEGFCSER
ncbi:MAG: helix-turn-helix transcriptional regulator [Bacilli bacterium]|nr:helix-turn-helix transcriptional regulator [Bacilli bacterium]